MKKFGRWKSFDFGPETSVDENKSPPKKIKSLSQSFKENSVKNEQVRFKNEKYFDFHKQIAPKTIADLAVHSKKLEEVEGWLKFVQGSSSRDKKNTQFLLLTGPTGCSKSTTIQVLCNSMNIIVSEWVNPVDIDYKILKGPGQVARFLEFITEAKYCSLFGDESEKKVIIVKDFPNVFVRNPEEFFNVLEECYFKYTHPIVFICTDSSSNEINLQRLLFPEEIQLKYCITHISFNSCAPTLLKKALKRAQDVISERRDLFKVSSLSTVDAILASSMGDVRCAMNQFYLASLIGSNDLPMIKMKEKLGTKRKRNDQSWKIKNMGRDETLGIFHGLGRVLNPKRRVEAKSWRLNCDIQKLVDEFSIQPSMFNAFLFENYLRYFGDLEDIEKSANILSFSTQLMENWENHETLVIGLWIAVLGLMIFNEHKVSKWNQIKGPQKLGKLSFEEDKFRLHPTDRFYYNLITKSQKYHNFNCDF